MDVDEVVVAAPQQPSTVAATLHELPTRIVTPSPFPQHAAVNSRFRNALSRVTADPITDTEAWQAVLTEVAACYKSIDPHNPENYAKLDWVESCYGAVLHHFPYAVTQLQEIGQILLQQCGVVSRNPLRAAIVAQRSENANAKLTHLLRTHLGVYDDDDDDKPPDEEPQDNAAANTETTKPHNDHHQRSIPMCTWVVDLWLLYIQKVEKDASSSDPAAARQAVTAAYERAVAVAGAVHHDNHKLWAAYLQFVQSWVRPGDHDHAAAQKQMLQLRSVYQRCIVHPMQGLEQVWHAYEAFEKQQSEALAIQLLQDFGPKYQHARTVYLERNRVVTDLQLGRLATPPVADSDDDDSNSDYRSKMMEEYRLLTAWKVRCSYERTNPARLNSAELAASVRHAFQEMACTLTRHAESWHMWSTWEQLQGSASLSPLLKPTDEADANDKLPPAARHAVQILQLGQQHIPDSTLLALAETQIVERHAAAQGCAVLENFLARSPNTLGYVLYQRMVRRYHGKEKARAVFARARRVLAQHTKKVGGGAVAAAKGKEEAGEAAVEGGDAVAKTETTEKEENGNRWMVTNRLDSTIGANPDVLDGSKRKKGGENENGGGDGATAIEAAGPITWHLYASHAVMEHRLNRAPEVAARVYELGLRKHASFLTVPAYIRRYAQLLLELNDYKNLRALLTRAVAACEAENKKDALASLWDMTLYFESIIGSDAASAANLFEIEKKRREAIKGPDVEDVATGGLVGANNSALIGAQKSTISEQLVRSDGYEVSSRIVNGMSREVDLLGIMGLWGTGEYESHIPKIKEDAAEFSGGRSDIGFQKRLQFQQMTQAGLSLDAAAIEGGGPRMPSARERLAGPTGPAGGTAIMLAIQQSPDWLRPLLLLLPASRLRLPIVAKPPPHLTEMALSSLRQNALPAERPADDTSKSSKRKRSENTDGNSSDEDNGVSGSSGYGNTFRQRQRARMQANGTTTLN